MPLPSSTRLIVCDVSTGSPRPFVPSQFRRQVFTSLHALHHPGSRATRRLVSARFVWPSMNKDLQAWVRTCPACQRAKVHRHTKAPLSQFVPPDQRFDHVHIDLVGPLPPCQGYTYLLTCVDRFTRWPEAIPLRNATAEATAAAFLSGWVSRFGVPSVITTDRGANFESSLFHHLLLLLGSCRSRTTSYHPQCNGMVERFHRLLKSAIKAHPTPQQWLDILPLVLLSIRAVVREDFFCSSAELVYGTSLRLPGEYFTPPASTPAAPQYVRFLRDALSIVRPTEVAPRVSDHRLTFIPKDLSSCEHVYLRVDSVRKPLQPPYSGPHRVLKRSDKYMSLEVNGKRMDVSIDRVKPAYLISTDPIVSVSFSADSLLPVPEPNPSKPTLHTLSRSVTFQFD